MKKARILALYLPQFHPIKENDEFWGRGFTEWRNVAKAKPLFAGHNQPRIPADLGFYDLRLEQVREEQAMMAKEYGIEGFCYWHYWFGNGKMLLEKPLEWVVQSGKPDFPFCVGWANHSWSNKTWETNEKEKKIIDFVKQDYLGDEDIISHFMYLLPMFQDKRYVCVDEKPLFMVFNPSDIPDNSRLIEIWNNLAKKHGLKGIHFVARLDSVEEHETQGEIATSQNTAKRYKEYLNMGYDAIYSVPVLRMKKMTEKNALVNKLKRKLGIEKKVDCYDYCKMIPYMLCEEDKKEYVYPQIMPRWDNTPRQGNNGFMFSNESPENFDKAMKNVVEYIKEKKYDHRIVFAHSWNEWGEGAYLEPDTVYGKKFLEVIKRNIL